VAILSRKKYSKLQCLDETWLNLSNILVVVVKLLVFHDEIWESNAFAIMNIQFMSKFCDTFHVLISALKERASIKIPDISSTFDVYYAPILQHEKKLHGQTCGTCIETREVFQRLISGLNNDLQLWDNKLIT
jgi:hypothetical protein